MNLVLDNNVLISALLWHGEPARLVFSLTRNRKGTLTWSPALEKELIEVLKRDKFTQPISQAGLTPESLVEQVRSFARLVVPPPGFFHLLNCVIATIFMS